MKPTADWDEAYILNLPPGEHDWVEFKGTPLLDFGLPGIDQSKIVNELSKQISAFANSGGGNIVYGVRDADAATGRLVDAGGVSLTIKKNTKEWLEDVIPNLVESALPAFNVYVITRKDAASGIAADKAIFVIEIPDSESAPHQATDKKYYARIAGKSKPIGHRMVLDILGRIKHPKIEVGLEARWRGRLGKLHVVCRNVGRVYANYVNGFIYVPSEWIVSDGLTTDIGGESYKRMYIENIHKDLVDFKPGMPGIGSSSGTPSISRYVTRYDPVLPGLGFSSDFSIRVPATDISQRYIRWEIYADNAPIQEGKIRVGEIKNSTVTD